MLQTELAHPDVAPLVKKKRAAQVAARRELFERAIVRGELPPDTDTALLVEFITAPLVTHIIHMGLEVDDHFIDVLSDVIGAGGSMARRTDQ
jgi:hypothetical protein